MKINNVPQIFPTIFDKSVRVWKFDLDIIIFAWRKISSLRFPWEQRQKISKKLAAAVIWSQAEHFSA